MAHPNVASRVAAVWDETLETSPDPLRDEWLFDMLGAGPRRSYRERLDARAINHRGAVIPRIARVRRNIILLGDPKWPASRLPR